MVPDLLTLFAEPSVAMLYFMSVIVLSCAAFLMALGQRARGENERAARRYSLASLGITVAWMTLMIGAIGVLVSGRPAASIMPPLDRAVGAMVVLLAGWAFLVTERIPVIPQTRVWSNNMRVEPSQIGLAIFTALAIIVIAAGYAYTAVQWFNTYTPQSEFNPSAYGVAWTSGTAILAVLMIAFLLLRLPSLVDAPLKIAFFVIILGGYSYTLYATSNGLLRGSDAGVLRLAFLAAMPLLPVVVYRMIIERLTVAIQERATQATVSTLTNISQNLLDTTVERESVTLLKALGVMLEREKPEDLPRQIAVATASMLKADVTALLVIDDAEYADVIAAYDNVQQRPIAAMALKLDEQPTLQSAMHTLVQETLSTDKNLNELVDLFTRLDIQKVGPVYFQPLTREGELVGVLVVAMPYTQRDLRETEKRLLESLAPISARMLAISRAAQRSLLAAQSRPVPVLDEGGEPPPEAPISTARVEMQASLELARQQINELSAKVRELQIELDFERGRMAELVSDDPEGTSITQRMERMSAERAQLEAERERLMQALQEAQTQLASATGSDDEVYETAIRILQQERDELQSQKEKLEAQLAEIRARGEGQAPAILRDMLTRLSEEKARFAQERDQLKAQLNDVEAQLAAVGIEGGAQGLVNTIVQLTDERSRLKTIAERAVQDRNMLLVEMQKIRDRILTEHQRDKKIAALENDVKRLAHDNEVLARQRDSLRQERDQVYGERSQWEDLRARMVADITALQADLEEMTAERNRAIAERNKLAEERATLLAERDKLIAGRAALQTERDQLLSRVEGNREKLQQLSVDGVETMKQMIDELTEERSELEHKILQANRQIQTLRTKLEDAQRRLTEIRKTKSTAGTFDAESAEVMLSVAQELRSPLTAIGVYVDLLLGESVGILSDLQQRFLQRVKANGDRLAELIEDFIRVVAIDTGRLKLKITSVDMSEIIDDAITATRTQFHEKGITLRLDLPDKLPPLMGDRGGLQQIVVELLSNAYRASPTDGEVTVTARYDRNFHLPGRSGEMEVATEVVFLSVKDNGGGIPTEEQPRVFSRFYRADNPLIQGLGDTGVGLSIARALTEAHGGQIWLESTPGQSTTFMLAIPLQGVAQPDEKAEYVAS